MTESSTPKSNTCCPSCGTALRPDGELHFDHESGVVTGYGCFVLLTGQEMDLVETLRARWPRVVTKEQMLDAMYGHCIDEPEPKIMDVFVCKVKKKLNGVGFDIENAWGRGYRLVYTKGEKS